MNVKKTRDTGEHRTITYLVDGAEPQQLRPYVETQFILTKVESTFVGGRFASIAVWGQRTMNGKSTGEEERAVFGYEYVPAWLSAFTDPGGHPYTR